MTQLKSIFSQPVDRPIEGEVPTNPPAGDHPVKDVLASLANRSVIDLTDTEILELGHLVLSYILAPDPQWPEAGSPYKATTVNYSTILPCCSTN